MSRPRPIKTNPKVDTLPWQDIQAIFSVEEFKAKFGWIPQETLIFAANKRNRSRVIASALKSMKVTNPGAINNDAEALADRMQYIAKILLQEEKVK